MAAYRCHVTVTTNLAKDGRWHTMSSRPPAADLDALERVEEAVLRLLAISASVADGYDGTIIVRADDLRVLNALPALLKLAREAAALRERLAYAESEWRPMDDD
jgi:hypothetical protein